MTIQTSPENWPWSTVQAAVCGLDIRLAQDHSALITAGAWQSGARSIIGVKGIKQFPIGMPLDEVADFAAETARGLGARVVFDCSNNSAFASILAARFGSNPANVLVAGVITNAGDHAAMPTPMMLSVGGLKSAIPRWTLSKRELIECVSAESDGGTLRTGKCGDWEALREELSSMERTVRASGSVAYSAPSGKHDDLIMALALAVFGLRRIGGAASRRRARRREPFGVGAWT
ncbi:MAG: hypothetical protein ABSD11_09625 [Methylocella sp.]